jgi:hypothetical protein
MLLDCSGAAGLVKQTNIVLRHDDTVTACVQERSIGCIAVHEATAGTLTDAILTTRWSSLDINDCSGDSLYPDDGNGANMVGENPSVGKKVRGVPHKTGPTHSLSTNLHI